MLATTHPALAFVTTTFALALVPWFICYLGQIDPFGDARWLPLLLLMVWAPSVSGLLWAALRGEARGLLASLLVVPKKAATWLLALTPLWVMLPLWRGGVQLDAAQLLGFFGFHLILGPLGEELGWRGFLLPRLQPLGTLGAPTAVGLIWGVWHAPLWWLNSPQSQIPFGVFVATCVCYSLVMSAAQWLEPASLLPAVLFHWLANVTVGLLILGGSLQASDAYARLLPFYAIAAAIAACINWRREAAICVGGQHPELLRR